jgi:acetolactate decarboxylase
MWRALTILLLGVSPPAGAAELWEVGTYGSLREIFHERALDPVVELEELLPDTALYAVGALSELRGEITIVAGVPYVSYPTEQESRPPEKACLLTIARVTHWTEATLEEKILFEDLDESIVALAASVGLSTDQAFPFLLESEVEDLRWHVIDGSRLPEGAGTHKDHIAAAVTYDVGKASATVIGFYSAAHHGVFTHMGSNTHVHCVVPGRMSSGHVDHMVLPEGTRIRFPVTQTD